MKFEFDKNLYRLARAFEKRGATLYIVGGFVRDALLGRPAGDIDLCSRLKLNQVEECARECGFNYICLSSKMGVCKLTIKNEDGKVLGFEHATFRKEKYKYDGSHTPIKVEFVDTIKMDSMRRDFTVNALYLNILKNRIFDPQNAKNDLKTHKICIIGDPNARLCEDSERILRAIRLAGALGFSLDENTKNAIVRNKEKLKALSKVRTDYEISKMVDKSLLLELGIDRIIDID